MVGPDSGIQPFGLWSPRQTNQARLTSDKLEQRCRRVRARPVTFQTAQMLIDAREVKLKTLVAVHSLSVDLNFRVPVPPPRSFAQGCLLANTSSRWSNLA